MSLIDADKVWFDKEYDEEGNETIIIGFGGEVLKTYEEKNRGDGE